MKIRTTFLFFFLSGNFLFAHSLNFFDGTSYKAEPQTISAFPNPVFDTLYLREQLIKSGMILDVEGKVVKRIFEIIPVQQIDVSSLKPGSYVLMGSSDYLNFRVEFIKQ